MDGQAQSSYEIGEKPADLALLLGCPKGHPCPHQPYLWRLTVAIRESSFAGLETRLAFGFRLAYCIFPGCADYDPASKPFPMHSSAREFHLTYRRLTEWSFVLLRYSVGIFGWTMSPKLRRRLTTGCDSRL